MNPDLFIIVQRESRFIRMIENKALRTEFEEVMKFHPSGYEGTFHADFSKFLTPKEFKIVLKKLHQIRRLPRHPPRKCRLLSCNNKTKKEKMQQQTPLPLTQPCWYLNFVGCMQLGDDAMLHLDSIPPSVTHLDFSCCSLTPIGIGRLCKYLKESGSNIKNVRLWGNQIGNEGAIFLADMLKVNTTLKSLCIREKRKPSEAGAIISEVLGDRLTIVDDGLSPEGEETNEITYSGWRALGDAIAENMTLRFFDFANSKFENKDLLALVPGLRKNKSLISLDLRFSNITDYGVRVILQRLILNDHNRTIEDIELPDLDDDLDPITDETMQELEYTLGRNHLLHREEVAKKRMLEDDTTTSTTTSTPFPTDKDWLKLLAFTSTNKKPTCSFLLLRNDKPNLCDLALR